MCVVGKRCGIEDENEKETLSLEEAFGAGGGETSKQAPLTDILDTTTTTTTTSGELINHFLIVNIFLFSDWYFLLASWEGGC